jgi:hypothetical protein
MPFNHINYQSLNPRQQENYNYHKVSAILADYGFTTLRLSDDWQGTDFIAQHVNGTFMKVQLKGRLSVDRKYFGKNLWICFRTNRGCCLYEHDPAIAAIEDITPFQHTQSWINDGDYSFSNPSLQLSEFIRTHELIQNG